MERAMDLLSHDLDEVPAPLFTMYVTVSTRILSATSKRKLAKSGKQGFTVRNRNQYSYFKQKGRNLVLVVSQEGMAELDWSCVSRNYLKVTLNNWPHQELLNLSLLGKWGIKRLPRLQSPLDSHEISQWFLTLLQKYQHLHSCSQKTAKPQKITFTSVSPSKCHMNAPNRKNLIHPLNSEAGRSEMHSWGHTKGRWECFLSAKPPGSQVD